MIAGSISFPKPFKRALVFSALLHVGLIVFIVVSPSLSRPRAKEFPGELDRALWEAHDAVEAWPRHDLFRCRRQSCRCCRAGFGSLRKPPD